MTICSYDFIVKCVQKSIKAYIARLTVTTKGAGSSLTLPATSLLMWMYVYVRWITDCECGQSWIGRMLGCPLRFNSVFSFLEICVTIVETLMMMKSMLMVISWKIDRNWTAMAKWTMVFGVARFGIEADPHLSALIFGRITIATNSVAALCTLGHEKRITWM